MATISNNRLQALYIAVSKSDSVGPYTSSTESTIHGIFPIAVIRGAKNARVDNNCSTGPSVGGSATGAWWAAAVTRHADIRRLTAPTQAAMARHT